MPVVKEDEAGKGALENREFTINPASEGSATNEIVMVVVGGNRKEQTGVREVDNSTAGGKTNIAIR